MSELPPGPPVAALREVLLASSLPLFVVDDQAIIVDANEAGATMVGATGPADIIGSSMFGFVTEQDRDKAHRALRDLAEGVLAGFFRQLEVLRIGGATEWAPVWAQKVEASGGRLILIGAVPRTVVDLARMGPSYHGQFAMLTTDHDWRVADASPGAERALGPGAAELAGAPLLGMVHPLDAGPVLGALARLGDDNEALSVRVRVRAGVDWREVQMTASALCRHRPPRLVCLLSLPRRAAQGAPEISGGLVSEAVQGEPVTVLRAAAKRHGFRMDDLSAQHWEIVTRLMRGQSPTEVGEAMFLSPRTVRNHLSVVYHKFGVHSQAALLSAIYGVYGARPTQTEGTQASGPACHP